MAKISDQLAETLRQQIITGLETGLWDTGARLPSLREMGGQMGVDPRVVADAYKVLAADGLLELRDRSGAYISESMRPGKSTLATSAVWISDIVADGVAREIPVSNLAQLLSRATETMRLRAFVVAPTYDQLLGLSRELRTYYGLEATGVMVEELDPSSVHPIELRRAELVVTTGECLEVGRRVSGELGIPCITVSVRLDLIGPAWQNLMQSATYVVVTDERFGAIIKDFISSRIATAKVEVLVAGRDDLDAIPADATVYLTQSARESIGQRTIRGRIVPPARILSRDSSLEIIRFIVEANLAAFSALPARRPETA